MRELQGFTQDELARKVDVSQPTIRRLENDDPRVKMTTRAKVAEELGLTFDWSGGKILPPNNLPPEAFADSGKPVAKSIAPAAEDEPKPKQTGLALSGGGSRAAFDAGVLRALLEDPAFDDVLAAVEEPVIRELHARVRAAMTRHAQIKKAAQKAPPGMNRR